MQTIGQRLKAAREEKQIPLEKVFQAIRIRVNYLKALEEDDLSSMPSPVQARGYLRNYAEYLGLDIDQLLEEVRASQQNTAGEIIGPADFTDQPAIQTPQPDSSQDATPPSPLTVDSAQETGPQPESVKPKRRGRKKVEPELIPVVESQSKVVEEPAPQPEPVVEEIAESKDDEAPQPDVTENLWQTWLNRVSSMISVRANRKSDTQDSPATEPSVISERPEPSQVESQQLSEEIFKEIGAGLRHRRETLSLHLEEVERNTRVKAHYLEALELGAMDRLPSTVQTRGMLSNYASFLDMDVDVVLLRFADALQARHRERNPQRPVREPGQPILSNMPALRNFIAGDMIFGIGMAVLLVGFVIWGINRVLTLQSLEEIQPTAPSISDVLLASPDPSLFTTTPTFLPVESFLDEATPTISIPTVNINVSVQVNLVAVERTYVRVIVDGEVVFEGRVIPGNAYLFEAEEQVEVLVGSGAAIRIAYNGRDLGLMGTFGQIVNNIYRADEIITPTGLPLPTPTNTAPPSPTVRPTNTPVASRTPIPSSTPVP
ncbi:MAG TPA: RodZ domain-containing protein [Anaerolineales bacterium]|nr:RodZ domain-containing protein [Anaerolineales bacterium]